jgi:pantoate--beta-alanine ligase
MSSRNQYLNQSEKVLATNIYKTLELIQTEFKNGDTNRESLIKKASNFLSNFSQIKLDYLEIREEDTLKELETINNKARIFIACVIGQTRLIDNLKL